MVSLVSLLSGRMPEIPPQATRIAAGVLAIAVLGWAGTRASRLDAARRLDLRRAQETIETFAALRIRYKPVTAAESIAWRRIWMKLRELGVVYGERLALTQRVEQAAKVAGLRDVRVLLGEPDTTGQQARLSTEGVQSNSAPFSLVVECRGKTQSVIGFLGQLPQSVAPTRLSLVRQDGRGLHRISLAVYELTFSSGVPPGWTSLEPSNSGAGRSGRPGG